MVRAYYANMALPLRQIILVCLVFLAWPALAQYSSSTNFQILDQTIGPGGYSTSTSYSLSSALTELGIGTSTTAGNLSQVFAGFLFFPYITTPAVSATAGSGQVSLSWTAADGVLGWSVGAYEVGQSTTSGSSYSYTNVGSTPSSTRTGLTSGTPYYFVVRVLDAEGNVVATSTEVSATPTSAPSGGGGGGGGGGGSSSGGNSFGSAMVNFSGRAYPRSVVTILKDAQVVGSTVADATANFSANVGGLSGGNYFFSIYSEDSRGNRSSLLTFPIGVTNGTVTNVSGVYLAPTIAVDKLEVRRGDNIAIFGQSAIQSEVTIQVNSDEPVFAKINTDGAGAYLYNFDSSLVEYGDHTAKSKSAKDGEISSFSQAVAFKVGTQNVLATLGACSRKGDVNKDCKVNLVDFSVVAYWYKRSNLPLNVDLNGDGKVDLVDFSILAFNWTG